MNKQQVPFEKTTKVFERIASAVFRSKKPYRLMILQGGTSSSKTVSVLQLLCLLATREKVSIAVFGSRSGALISGVIRDMEMLHESSEFLQQVIRVVRRTGKIYIADNAGYIMKFNNGSIIRFASIGGDSSSGKIADANFKKVREAGKFDYIYINECNNIPEKVFESAFVRANRMAIVDFNADAAFYIHERYRERYIVNSDLTDTAKARRLNFLNNVYWDISTYKDNPFCSPEIADTLEAYRDTDPLRWRVYGQGFTGVLPDNNRFFYSFNELQNKGVTAFSPYNGIVLSFDFNHRNMVVLVAQTSENVVGKIKALRFSPISENGKQFLHVIDEIVIKEPMPSKSTLECALDEIMRRYGTHIKSGNFVCVGDLSGQAGSHLSKDSSWQTVFNRLGGNRNNYIVSAINPDDPRYPKANPPHRETFNVANSIIYSLKERFIIDNKCKVLLSDVAKAVLRKSATNKYELYKDSGDFNMNAADCLRYLIYFSFYNLK